MTIEQLAAAVLDACEMESVDHMLTDAFAHGLYGILRSTKDVDDARDVLAVQGPETLDMAYIEEWCALHGTLPRLREALAGIPPLD